MKQVKKGNTTYSVPNVLNLLGILKVEIEAEGMDIRLLFLIGILVGLLGYAAIGFLVIYGLNFLLPTPIEYSVVNFFAVNFIRFGLLKIDKDD